MRQRQAELAHALRISTVGELASGLAHELNQPLSAIANGVEACARYVRSGKAKPKKLLALLDDASARGAARRRASWSICATSSRRGSRNSSARICARSPATCRVCWVARSSRSTITLRLDLHPRPAADLRGPHPDRAGHRELDAERHRRHSRSPQATAERSSCRCGQRRAWRKSPCATPAPASLPQPTERHVRAVLHHQGAWSGNGPGDQPLHHRGASGPDLGGAPRATAARGTTVRFTLPLQPPKAARKRRSA